tara:strand:+ start:226 stop:402 length:177 start_codon:yes stop_codon:yes gene_type:complete
MTSSEKSNLEDDQLFNVFTIIYLIFEFLKSAKCFFKTKFDETKEKLKKRIKSQATSEE